MPLTLQLSIRISMKITKYATSLFCAAVLAFAPFMTTACKEPKNPPGKVYSGLWKGTDENGDVYSIHISGNRWECRIERGGVSIPHYRGTVTHSNAGINLLIKEDADFTTMGWRPTMGYLGPNLIGDLLGGGSILKITAITKADLYKN